MFCGSFARCRGLVGSVWLWYFQRKYVHEVLVNHLVKLAHEKNAVMWTDRPNMIIAVDWDVKQQTKQKTKWLYKLTFFKKPLDFNLLRISPEMTTIFCTDGL